MSKNSKTFRSRSSDHVPVVPTMVTSGNVGVKRIHVFRNADVFFAGIQVVVNTHRVPSIDVLLDVISERIGLINGAKKLYTTGGTHVKDINKIRDGEYYVASSSHFTPMAYGGMVQNGEEKKKKKKKRSKTVHEKERKKEKEIVIPFNEPQDHPPHHLEEKHEKKLKKKKKSAKRKGSNGSIAETAEVELPSEVEDSEDEQDVHEDSEDDHRSKGHHSIHHSPEPSRPSTAFRHNTEPPRSTSRRGSRTVKKEENEKERKKSVPAAPTRRKSKSVKKSGVEQNEQPNWGDLSSFTKNIESLLRN